MRNKKFRFIILGILLIALPLLLLGIKQTLDNRSSAAAADKLEAEDGTLNGNTTKIIDTSASGGSYVVLGNNQTSQTTGIYGPLTVGDSLNNSQVGGTYNRKVANRFRATENSALNSIRIYIIDQTNPGYGGGTGGTMRISVQSDDGTSNHAPSGTVLASLNASNFKSGAGILYTFPTPATLVKGNLYHIVFENTDPNPTVNFVSTDLMFQFNMDGSSPQWQPGISNTDWAELTKLPNEPWTSDRGTGKGTNTPIMQLNYANGNYAGVGYIEFWVDPTLSQTKTITGPQNMIREKITVTGGDKTINDVNIRLKRISGTGALNFRIEKSDGSIVDSGSIPSSEIPVVDPNNIRLSPNWAKATLSSPKTLLNGQTYYLIFSTDSNTKYNLATIRKGKAYGYGPLTYFADGNAQETSDGGSTWLAPISWIQNSTPRDPESDWQFYFTTVNPSTSQAPTVTTIPCPSNLQTAINNTSSEGTLDITGCSFSITSPINISKSITLKGGTISTTTTGITISTSNVIIDGVQIIGPQSSSYSLGQNGIFSNVSTQNITIKNSTIENFGEDGIRISNSTNLNISGNTVKNIVYSGILIMSGTGGTIAGNSVSNIGVTGYEANGMNAYGIALSDQGGPPSSGITISGNTIDNVPQWHGLDTHGGRNLSFINNVIHRTNRAIFITPSSANGAASDITISHNTMDTPTRRIDVINTYPYNEVGITVVAGSTNVSGTGNKFDSWPVGNHIDTQRGPNNFSNNTITNPQ